jgi:hypothetical protein
LYSLLVPRRLSRVLKKPGPRILCAIFDASLVGMPRGGGSALLLAIELMNLALGGMVARAFNDNVS